MTYKLTPLQQLLLVNIHTLGRCSLEQLHKEYGHSKPVLRKNLLFLVKEGMLATFNVGFYKEGSLRANYYKVYGIHFNYIEHMNKYVSSAKFVNPDGSVHAMLERSNATYVTFVIDGNKYERDPNMQCMMKNGQPMDAKAKTRDELLSWMRSKKKGGSMIRMPEGATEEDKDAVRSILRNTKKREGKALDSVYGI